LSGGGDYTRITYDKLPIDSPISNCFDGLFWVFGNGKKGKDNFVKPAAFLEYCFARFFCNCGITGYVDGSIIGFKYTNFDI